MSKVKILVGPPAAGKSTYADKLERCGWVVAERDRIRMETYGKWYGVDEDNVTKLQNRIIVDAIMGNQDVVISDTNLNRNTLDRIVNLCKSVYSECEIEIIPVGVDLLFHDLVERNSSRHEQSKVVPHDVLMKMYANFRELYPIQADAYDDTKIDAIIIDIDGTVADMTGIRGPFEWLRVEMDNPHQDVIDLVKVLQSKYKIVAVSGRDAVCRTETRKWLAKQGLDIYALHMRDKGCMMRDSAVKHDLYHQYIKPHYNVCGVFDDRDQVVKMWRSMGIRCYQVAYGNF